MIQSFLILFLPVLFLAQSSHAQFDDLKFKQALKLKKDFYVSDVSITGGDRTSSDFSISNVRIANNPAGFDRVVIDLAGNQNGKKSKLDRPPFYLIQVDSEHKRLLVTLYGKPKLDFSTQSAIQSAKKAKHISEIEFAPLTEQDRWTWAIHTKAVSKAEVFELTEPARIIIDLKQ